MTVEEFEEGYAERSGMTVERLYDLTFYGAPCDCEEEGCEGFQMRTKEKDFMDARNAEFQRRLLLSRGDALERAKLERLATEDQR